MIVWKKSIKPLIPGAQKIVWVKNSLGANCLQWEFPRLHFHLVDKAVRTLLCTGGTAATAVSVKQLSSASQWLVSFVGTQTLCPFTSAKDLEELTQEVHDFATMDKEELPKSVRELANANEGGSRLRPDIVWGHLQELTTLDGHKRFPRLSKIAMLVLTIPHSNAGEERVFSMIKKNLTSLRSCLDQEEALGSIMTIKMESLNSPGKIGLPPNVLKAAKSATRLYNKAHSWLSNLTA